jgi:hypothetical protein
MKWGRGGERSETERGNVQEHEHLRRHAGFCPSGRRSFVSSGLIRQAQDWEAGAVGAVRMCRGAPGRRRRGRGCCSKPRAPRVRAFVASRVDGRGAPATGGMAGRGIRMPVPTPLRRIVGVRFGLRGRDGGKVTTKPRAATMTSRRVAASAGRSSLSTARWRCRRRAKQEISHGDERRQNALQRLPVFLDRRIPVHRPCFLPVGEEDYAGGWRGRGEKFLTDGDRSF